MSVLRGDTRDPAERLALEMQKAAEERPLSGSGKDPMRCGRTLLAAAERANGAPLKSCQKSTLSIDPPRPSYSLDLREGEFTAGQSS